MPSFLVEFKDIFGKKVYLFAKSALRKEIKEGIHFYFAHIYKIKFKRFLNNALMSSDKFLATTRYKAKFVALEEEQDF
jgi:imidazoleglycerol phosphate synthase glutamine amidotransferase subunit HisH